MMAAKLPDFLDNFLNSACEKTQSALRKHQDQCARSTKKRSLHSLLDHSSGEQNQDIGIFLEAMNSFLLF